MLNISGIEDILPRHQEISNGSKKEYTVAFDLIDTKFVSVYLGSEKQTTGYSVDIENKKVTFNSAPTTGLLVTIVRVVPASWESELHGALNSDSLNILFTKIIASLQTIKEEVNRSLKSNVFDENNSEQKFEFFLKQLADAQDVLTRSENNLSLLETTGQDSLNSINTARDSALEDIEEIRSETISEVIELTDSFLDHDNITNCITEIPQDIKLELNNGTLTLKAGSAYYIPDGTKYIIPSDKTSTSRIASGEEVHLICINYTNNGFRFRNILNSTSGAGATTTAGFAYDTTTNKIGYYSSRGELQDNNCSLPIAIVRTDSSGYIASIIQIFNGFGYIGSTIFALPGVELLHPNGRNADGTLRNNEVILTTVLTNTTYRPSTNGYLICGGNAASIQKSAVKSNWYYDKDNNYVSTLAGDKAWMIWGEYITDENDSITSFQPKLPFRAVDWNDYVREVNSKQDISNLSQSLDTSTTKYPSNNAVKTVTDTKANDSEVIHKTGDETISDIKTFNDPIIRKETFTSGGIDIIKAIDTNGKGEVAIIPYYTGNAIYCRLLAKNTTSDKNFYLDIVVRDNGEATFSIGGSATNKTVTLQNLNALYVPTPSEGDNSQRAVNTAYLNSVMPTITYWD